MANEFIIKNGFHSKGDSQITGSLEVSGSNTNFILNSTDSKFTDSRATTKGIEYSADYSLNFTSRSLVDRDYVDNNITNNITASAGSGLTYNTTSSKIDLGGKIIGYPDDPSNTDNRIFFTPTLGNNQWFYGLTPEVTTATSSLGFTNYISQTLNFSFLGHSNIIGLYGSMIDNGTPSLGCFENQSSISYLKMYKDITTTIDSDRTIANLPGVNDDLRYFEADNLGTFIRRIYTSGSNAISASVSMQTSTNFLYQITGSTINEHSNFNLVKDSFSAGVTTNVGPFAGSSLLIVRNSGVNLYDASYCGIASFPDKSTLVGSIIGGNLKIQSSGSLDSTFTDSTDNKRGIKYIGFGETNTETGVGANYNTLVGTSLVPKKYLEDYVAASGSADTIYTANDTIGSGRVATITDTLTLAGGKLVLSSTNDGILLNRVTDSQMAGITGMLDNEIVFNKTKNALYRWNGSNWVALAAGFGIISLNDSSGNPTFYSDLSAAFTAASSGDVINLHSNITVTSTCSVPNPVNSNITLNGNGYTITYASNTGSEFPLFSKGTAANKSIYLNDIKIISNGSGVTNTQAVFSQLTIYANNNTFITATNNHCSYISNIDGGNWESTNNMVAFSGTVKNAVVKFKFSRSPFVNCDITIASGGFLTSAGNSGGDLISCIITGESTIASSMIVANDQNRIHGCKITCNDGPKSAIGYNTGNYNQDINPVPFQDNIVYHYGTGGYAIKATFTAVFKDSYIFSKNTSVMYTQNTTQVGGYNLENIILETNSTNNPAFERVDLGSLKMKNVTATNINPANTKEAFNIRVSTTSELYLENCTANLNNSTADHIKLLNSGITTGGVYIYGLTMSKIGAGLNLNTVPLLNSNTVDDFGNVQIG